MKSFFGVVFLSIELWGFVHSIYDPNAFEQSNFIDVDDTQPTKCPPGFTGQIPYAMDCRQFINCWRGRGIIQSCSPGTMFNPRTLECDHPSKVKCNTFEGFTRKSRALGVGAGNSGQFQRQEINNNIQCEFGASGLFEHPYDCTKFLNCDHGRTFVQDCGPGTAFNAVHKVCDWPQNVDCSTRNANSLDQAASTNIEIPTNAEISTGQAYNGEGMLDVRMNSESRRFENRPSNSYGFQSNAHNQRLPASDTRNQRRYPDQTLSQQNHVYNNGINSQDNTFLPSQIPTSNNENGYHNRKTVDILQQSAHPVISNSFSSTSSNNFSPKPLNSTRTPPTLDSVHKLPTINNQQTPELFHPSEVVAPSTYGNFGIDNDRNQIGEIEDDKFAREYDSFSQINPVTATSVESQERLGVNNNFAVPEENQQNHLDTHNGLEWSSSAADSNIRQQYPILNYLSPKTADDFKKYFTPSPKPGESQSTKSGESRTISVSSSISENVEPNPNERETLKVQNVYPSGFEDLGIKCETSRSGLSEHPYDCNKFINCENGKMFVQNCGSGFVFNPTLKICDFAKNVNCVSKVLQAPFVERQFDTPNNQNEPTEIPQIPSGWATVQTVNQNNDSENQRPQVLDQLDLEQPWQPQNPHITNISDKADFDDGTNGVDAVNENRSGNPTINPKPVYNQNKYFIPNMSVLPLSVHSDPKYPAETHTPAYIDKSVSTFVPKTVSYTGGVRPSQGADTLPENLDDINHQISINPSELWTRIGKEYVYSEPSTTVKPVIVHIPVGKEHIMPIYQRRTTTARPSNPTHKAYSPMDNYNKIYYKPFSPEPVEKSEQTDYIPVSEALKLLLRPYVNRNDSVKVSNDHVAKIEEKILDMIDEDKNVKTDHTASLEQGSLAAAAFNENTNVDSYKKTFFATENYPSTTMATSTEKSKQNTEHRQRSDYPVHSFHNHVHGPNDHPYYHHTGPFPSDFKHSPKFHEQFDKKYSDSSRTFSDSNDFSKSASNGIIFPGPPHNSYAHNYQPFPHAPHGHSYPRLPYNPVLPPPPMPPYHHYHHGHHSSHQHYQPNYQSIPYNHTPWPLNRRTSEIEETTLSTASAPAPEYYTPYSDQQTIHTARLGRVEAARNNCDNQLNCQNGYCVPFTKMCDGRNDCGNRFDELNCQNIGYEVRLSNDKGQKHMGRVEVKAFGKWGYVCDDKFNMVDAHVLCRELGYKLGAAEVKSNSYYSPSVSMVTGDQNIFMMDEVNCKGNETSLKDCDFNGWGVSDCNAEEVVGVVCKMPVMKCPAEHWLCETSEECIPMSFMCDGLKDCSDGSDESDTHCNANIEYRLTDGNEFEGRVEVKYRGVWGTVCDDDFRETEANVFCKSLGFTGPSAVIDKKYDRSTGPIWLDQVNCLGNETSLDKCMHFDWSQSNCNHTEDVSVRCSHGPNGKSSKYIADDSALQKLIDPETKQYLRKIQRSSKSTPDYSNVCGQVKVSDDESDSAENIGQFRVISGSRTKRGYHPWQATIRARGRNGKSSHWCGAVVISKNHILTAAHCLIGFPKGAYFIRLGDHHSEVYEDSEIEIFIENWFIHEEFRKGQHMNNDIALILLKSPIQYSNYIQPICLPSKETRYTPGKNCTISGWGSIQYGKSTPSLDLKAAAVPLISQDICRQKEIYGDAIMDTMFCAGYLDRAGVDACDGDSGGPLVCSDNGVNSLYGIISWGQRCGDSTKPGVYVKVTQYLDWIKDKMGHEN